jgi:hypothetical protein
LTTLDEILVAVHAALDDAKVPHAIGGAVALGYCIEEARGTVDLDVNIFLPTERVDAVFDALPSEIEIGPADRDRVIERAQVRLYWDDTAVDLFFKNDPFHDAVAARAREVPFGDSTIPILDCTDLLIFKALFSRSKDWVDIASMIQARSVDLVEASRWLGALLGTESVGYRRFVHLAEHDGAGEPFNPDLFGR